MQKLVIDESGLTGLYDTELEWVGLQSFHEALASIGLELVRGKGEIEIVVIEPLAAADPGAIPITTSTR